MLYSGLLVLLQSACVDLKNFCVKVLFKMINNDYVRLNCSDFITLMLVLTDGNYKLCIYFIDVFEKDFIPQNKHTISKYFIPLMFYMNNYEVGNENHFYWIKTAKKKQLKCMLLLTQKNEVISMKTRSIEFSDFSYERRVIIYKFLYCNLEQHSQNQILIALNENFLSMCEFLW